MLKKGSKIIALAVCFCLVGSLFTGCKPGSEGTSSETGEKVELKIFSYMLTDMANNNSVEDPILPKIEEKLNIKITPLTATSNNWKEKLSILMAGGETPDVFLASNTDSQFERWVQEGLILPIGDYQESYPNIKKILSRYELLEKAYGKHYALPIVNNLQTTGENGGGHPFVIRKDWLEKLNLEVPETLDDLYTVAKAFTENDPDGDGKKNTYGLSSSGLWWLYPIMNAYDASYERFKKVDGKWEPECISPQAKEAVSFIKKLADEKLLDPEFMINTDTTKVEKFTSGKAGMIVHNGGYQFYNQYFDKMQAAYPEKNVEDAIAFKIGLTGKNGKKRIDGGFDFWNVTCIKADAGEAKTKKALGLLDYLLSEEGFDLVKYGIEGTHFKNEGEEKVSLLGNNDKGTPMLLWDVVYSAKLKSLVSWDTEVPKQTKHYDDIVTLARSSKDYTFRDPLAFIRLDKEVVSSTLTKQLNDFQNETYVKLIASSIHFDADWDAFVKAWLEKGGQKLIDETNKVAQKEGR